MAISDYSTNPSENTEISGTDISEGCAPSGINDAIRQLMADIKEGVGCDYDFTTDTTSAHVKTVPSGAGEWADILELGCNTARVVSKNGSTIIDAFVLPEKVLRLKHFGVSAGTASNTVDLANLKLKVQAEEIDLSLIEWKLGAAGWTGTGFYSDTMPTIVKKPANDNTAANIVCSGYATSTASNVKSDATVNAIAIDASGNICIRDTSCTTVADLTAALSGVTLRYELATYAEEDLSGMLMRDNFIKVVPSGTLTFIDADDETDTSAVYSSIRYQTGSWGMDACLEKAGHTAPDRQEMKALYAHVGRNEEELEHHKTVIDILVKKDFSQFGDWEEIQQIVRNGDAADVFSVGDQLIVPWESGGSTKYNYNVPLDVVHFGMAEKQDGSIVPAMTLQWHYCTGPEFMPFDGNEALYYCEEAIPAGTVVTWKAAVTWGSKSIIANTIFKATLTKAVPAGGCLQLITGAVDKVIAEWRLYSYADMTTLTATETVSVETTSAQEGLFLGSWQVAQAYGSDSNLNQMHRSNYGYNRWSQSLVRQWLNSDAAADAWYTQQNKFDRPSAECAAQRGFLAGFQDDFLAVLTPVKVTTALNTVTDAQIGTTEDTFDTWFLPSLEEEYFVPQLAGVEGEAWDYWKERIGTEAPWPQGKIDKNYIRYGIDGTAASRSVRLRSAALGYGGYAWFVSPAGSAYYTNATNAYRCAPACVIC